MTRMTIVIVGGVVEIGMRSKSGATVITDGRRRVVRMGGFDRTQRLAPFMRVGG
jgi:hypothetical protein